jgi:hypothetical protein
MPERPDDRSIGELFAELSRETSTLVRKEVELATTEMTAKLKHVGTQSGIVAAGGALVHAGLLVLLAAIVILLAQLGVTPWLSALIVAIVVMAVGYFMASGALNRLRNASYAPRQTMETLKETTTWTTRTRA